MPTLTWTLAADERQLITGLQGAATAALAATRAVDGLQASLRTVSAAPIPLTVQDQATPTVQRLLADLQRLAATPIRIPVTTTGASSAGAAAPRAASGADPAAAAQRLAQQAATAQGAVQSLGSRLDTLQRQLQSLGQARPNITLTSNYQALQAQIATLQARLTDLSRQPYSVQVKTETAQVRADLTGLQRQLAGFKATLPPLAPKVESSAAEAALTRMQRGFQETGRAAQANSGAVSSFFSNALSSATGFLAANVFSKIAGGFLSIGQGAIQSAASMEQTRAGFTSILGSAQQADALIKQLQDEANKSPFNLENFRQAGQLLLGMGVAADQITPRLHAVSNVVAATGGGTAQFEGVNRALSQIQAKGKVSAEEMNQLADQNVAGWTILANALNLPIAKVQELAQQGKISADTFNQAFLQFANSDAIASAAEKQSHTFTGLVSTIQDVGQALGVAFGTPVIAAVEPEIEKIVNALKDPAVVATLSQWGAAAGQFAVGLLQAGETAFTVGGQIIQALSPVTAFLGDLLGIKLPALQAPDFTPAANSAAQFTTNVQAGGAAVQSVKDQIADLERTQRSENRAAAEVQLGYEHQITPLQEKIRLLDAAYQAENRSADIAELQAKIAKDSLLAQDVYSSQGQAAAKRLVDERAQLASQLRQKEHDEAKAGLEDQVRTLQAKKQAAQESAQAQARDTQERIDALRSQDTGAGGLVVKPITAPKVDTSAIKAASSEYSAFYGSTSAGATTWAGQIGQAIDDLKARLLTLGGGPGAVIGAVKESWDLLSGAFDATPGKITTMGSGFDDLIDQLGGRGGLQGVAISVRYEFERLFESLAAAAPTVLGALGRGFTQLADSINVATTSASEIIALFKLQTGAGTQAQFDQAHAAAQAAQKQLVIDAARGQIESQAIQGTYADRIKAINTDINRRENTDLTAAAARTQASRDARYGGVGVTSKEYSNVYAPPPAHTQVDVTVKVDKNGLLDTTTNVVSRQITGARLARNLGDYARSQR